MDHDDAIDDRGQRDLHAMLGAALARIEQLEATVTELTRPSAVPVPGPVVEPTPASAGSSEPAAADGGLDRRQAMKGAVLAAGAAAAGVVLGGARPAAAADGSTMIIGSVNQTATMATGVAISGTAAPYGFGITDNSRPASDVRPCLTGHAKNLNFTAAVEAVAEGSATGLYARAADGAAIDARSSGSAAAIRATAVDDPGLFARSTTDSAVRGESTSGPGVNGQSVSSNGVFAFSSQDIAIQAISNTGSGIEIAAPKFHLRLANFNTRPAPTTDTIAHQPGELVWTVLDDLWLCVDQGTPGRWMKLGGQSTAGAFHVLPAPVRVYDSRPGTAPSQGPKSTVAVSPRVLDCTVNGSGVPAGATAVALTVLLVNASNGNGNFTVWANGVAKPVSNTMVWGAGSGRYTTSAISAVDASGKLQVSASATTDLVLDVVGYYR